MTNHQRVGALSNAHAGREFELAANAHYLGLERWKLQPNFRVPIGVGGRKKDHRFDLGCEDPPVLVECKSHNFTATGNMPSAKMTVWNEAMYYFHLAPAKYRKILFVLEARHERQRDTLASCYVRNYGHLIPPDVETTRDIWNGVNSKAARRIPKELWPIVRRKLDQIDAVTRLDDLRVPPGNRLHALAGDLEGQHAVRVNDQYRIVFRFEGSDAFDLRCTDYH